MACTFEHQAAFGAYSAQASRERTDTALAILTFLREHYPKHHVTRADASHFDIFGFADKGHAELEEDLNLGFDATRRFSAPRVGPRVLGSHRSLGSQSHKNDGPGKLIDDVRFGRWSCTWNDHHYILYHVTYCASGESGRYNFVLSPFGSLVSPGAAHHPNTDALLQAVGSWSKDLHDEINVFNGRWWHKDAKLLKAIKSTTWDDVIMDADVKSNLQRDVLDFFDNEELYHSLSVPWKRGIILHGVPGNGKTLTLKALIKTLSEREDPIPSLYVKSVENGGEMSVTITGIFEHARKMSPCLLVFEDLDSLVDDRNRSYFLNEVDGLEDNKGILMVGSTNHLNKLDSSITKRPSRFDRKYHFNLPRDETRQAYCEFWRRKIETLPRKVDFPADLCPIIAKWTEGFSFAYMKELFMSAMVLLVTGTHEENEYEDVLEDAECGSDACSTVVVSHSTAGEGNDAEKTGNDTEAGGVDTEKKLEEGKKQPKVLPEVDIADSLQGNLLLAILRSQVKALLADMDDTTGK